MNGVVVGVIGLTIAIIVTTSVLIPQIKGVNTSGWDASEVALYSTLSIAVFIGLMYSAYRMWGLA